MKVSILAFGIAKDIVGSKQFELEVADDASVKTLKETLGEKYPEFKALRSFAVAVNSEYGEDDLLLKGYEELAIIPPVSGG